MIKREGIDKGVEEMLKRKIFSYFRDTLHDYFFIEFSFIKFLLF